MWQGPEEWHDPLTPLSATGGTPYETGFDIGQAFPNCSLTGGYSRILNETNIEGAIQVATSSQRAFSNNHLIANAGCDIFGLEVTGSRWAMLYAGNCFLVHANHLLSPEMTELDADGYLNSRLRQKRVEQLIEGQLVGIDMDSLTEIMSDYSNCHRSVCKHHVPESDLDYGTIGSVVIDVTNRVLRARAGNPCRGEWREVRL